MSETNIIEIFSSVQGEGKYVGCRQVFVRFADCNLRCAYCDTDFSRQKFCSVETVANSDFFRQIKNPLSGGDVADIIKDFIFKAPIHSVSLTGGEPLLHWNFISELANELKKFNVKIFLETNGTLANELQKILFAVDIISMDIKLPSAIGKNFFDLNERFLKVAQKKDLYVKIVVSEETPEREFYRAVDLIVNVSPKILLIIQPVTPVGKIKAAPPEKILKFQAAALKKLNDVRVIPQTHKIINLM